MSTPKCTWILGLGASAMIAGAAVVACSNDSVADRRAGFESPDAGVDAVAGGMDAAVDAGAGADAGEERGPFDPTDEAVVCAGTEPCAKQLVAGANHFCALMNDGTVRCWGDDEYGALGGGLPPKDPKGPSPDAGATKGVDGLAGATQISAARSTTCARANDGSVYCWGSNSQGQLGLDDVTPSWDEDRHPTALQVAVREPVLRVDVGAHDVCAVLATGKVTCWGTNEQAQLARPGAELTYVLGPALASLEPFAIAKTSLGSTTGLALTTGGEVVSWGEVAGKDGFIGGRMTSINPDVAPNAIAQLKNVTSLATTMSRDRAGGGGGFPPPPRVKLAHACAIANGEVYCWGRSDVGALCTGMPDEEILPAHAPVKGKAWPQQIAVGDEITCVRMTDGSIQCCGGEASGRLGTGQTDPFSAFLKPIASFASHAVQVAASDRAVCVLVQGGSVECWGGNSFGELGTGARDDDPHPTPVKVVF
ncbi:MAG TPA: hypothetical protein VM925_30160 [Labilithrix sp.]|nr:hypothetical protein [Labilithrix sp.]